MLFSHLHVSLYDQRFQCLTKPMISLTAFKMVFGGLNSGKESKYFVNNAKLKKWKYIRFQRKFLKVYLNHSHNSSSCYSLYYSPK